jgi:hypothetical protein
MIQYILTPKWLDPMTGDVWTDEPVARPAPSGVELLHPLQFAQHCKCAPKSLAVRVIAGGHWKKVAEFDDGRDVEPEKQNWKALGAEITSQPVGGPAMRGKPAKTAANVKPAPQSPTAQAKV